MGHGERDKHGYLEIVGEAGDAHTVFCPRKDQDMPLEECLRCKRYHSLALDPTGARVYLDCDWVGSDEVRPKPEVDETLGTVSGDGAARRRGEPDDPA